MMHVYGEYFYGNKISDYGIKNGYVDYGTLAKAFDAVLNNTIPAMPEFWDYTEQLSGMIDNSEEIENLEDSIAEREDSIAEAEEAGNSKAVAKLQRDIDGMQSRIDQLTEEQEEQPEIFQWYIVSEQGAELLQECNEIVYYNSAMDLYFWGVTHYGTAWSYVLTDIKCNTGEF